MRNVLCGVVLLFASVSALSQQGERGVGFPTVAAALDALKSRRDVKISVQGGWTIVNDSGANAIWSFAPPNHPAHPAVVKRAVVQRDSNVFIDMSALCQAPKPACDKLIEEFKELNDRTIASIQSKVKGKQEPWAPPEEQKARAQTVLSSFLSALDEARYQDAYNLFTAGTKALIPYEKFAELERLLLLKSGGEPSRGEPQITWYKDPPRAALPGVYAAYDIPCRYRNINTCMETIILHEQGNGEFLVIRKEQTIVSKEAEQAIQNRPKADGT